MTEVLGVIASGIAIGQVAGKTGVAVLRLKRLVDEVRDVPRNISDLIDEIQCFDPALWEFEQGLVEDDIPPELWKSPAANRSAVYCRKALRELMDAIDDLSAQINSPKRLQRKVACVKAVLKKNTLDELERRLESIVRMLQCAQQGYLIALVKQQTNDIADQLLTRLEQHELRSGNALALRKTQDQRPEQVESSIETSVNHTRSVETKRASPQTILKLGQLVVQSDSQNLSASIRPPRWLKERLTQAWALQDDVRTLSAILEAREGSPFDINDGGNGLVHYAANSGAVATLKFLAQIGCEVNGSLQNDSGFTPIDWLDVSEAETNRVIECFELLKHDWSTFLINCDNVAKACGCPRTASWEAFCLLQPLLCPYHDETPLSTRLQRVRDVNNGHVERFIFILNPDWSLDPDKVCNLLEPNCSLIHTVAKYIATLRRYDFEGPSASSWARWEEFAIEVFRRSNNIHHVETHWRKTDLTPCFRFLYDICKHCYRPTGKQSEDKLKNVLSKWLHIVQAAGIDLYEYGLQEARLKNELDTRIEWVWNEHRELPGNTHTCMGFDYRIIGIRYGAEICDWGVWVSEPTDAFAGDFWRHVEEFECRVPGAWYDSDDE